MPYGYTIEELLNLLHSRAPAKADAVARHRHDVEHGLLSVGLKLHWFGDQSVWSPLINGLGGAKKILHINMYKHAKASSCLVLPPVGSARVAIQLLECIGQFLGTNLFGNKEVQIQVCSPARLNVRTSAVLAIGFYLGSDTLRRFAIGDLSTTVSADGRYSRGNRLVIYDAQGEFEQNFQWWRGSGKHRLIQPRLPFKKGRSDIVIGAGSRKDIENINLLATLLVHKEFPQHAGYWTKLGAQFEAEIERVLTRHALTGLLDAPWVRTRNDAGDIKFYAALQELMAYVFSERVRIKVDRRLFLFNKWREIPAQPSNNGILLETQLLLKKYREELLGQSLRLDQQHKGDHT